MPPPDPSPLRAVVLDFWPHRLKSAPELRHLDLIQARRRIWLAALQEMEAKFEAGILYDPGRDARFEWACQWLDRAEGLREAIDPDVIARVEFVLDLFPRTPSGRDLAAGESPLTLAQGQ